MDAEQIVRALAKVAQPLSEIEGEMFCAICETEIPYQHWGVRVVGEPSDHATTCPWRLAKEWVARGTG